MKVEAPNDLSACTDAELVSLAAAADRVRFAVQLELHQRGSEAPGAAPVSRWPLMLEGVYRGKGKRRMDWIGFAVAMAVAVALGWWRWQ